MRVNKDEFLHALEHVQCGLSVGESVEQGTCFVFKDEHVHAFNKKTYARYPCRSPVDGAVHAKPLLTCLRKLTAEEVYLDHDDAHLLVRYGKESKKTGKPADKIGVRLEALITLPIKDVDEPEKWSPMHESFSDALTLVQECAGKDREYFVCTCVHVHPKWLEAYDRKHATRYRIETGVSKPSLVERDVLKHVIASGVDEVGETENWLHFRGGNLRISCMRMMDEYPDIGSFFKNKGEPATLPRSLTELADVGEVFSSENKDANVLLVELRPGKMKIHGQGETGFATGFRDCEYEGNPVKFYLSPSLLKGLNDKSSDCFIGGGKLLIDGGNWRYCSALGEVIEREEE